MRRGSFAWARRGVLAASLLAVIFVPYPATGNAPAPSGGRCAGVCRAAGSARVLWSRKLPGHWAVSSGLAGTVPATGPGYAAVGHGLAVVGTGQTVQAYSSRTGVPLWRARLSGFPPGAAVVSVRAWPGAVTAGVGYGPARGSRAEVVLSGSSGQQIRRYPASPFGGAVSASAQTTVVVGPRAVTSYDNLTGKTRWQRPTGPAAQAWQDDGTDLYVTVAAGGYLRSQPVTALRRINLKTGAETIVRPGGRAFAGNLGGAIGGAVLFAAASGVTAYDAATGVRLWSLAGAVPEGVDPLQARFYLTEGTALIGVDPQTGAVLARAPGSTAAGSAGLYVVRDDVALGLDQGPNGEAWGYDVTAQRVTWTVPGLPWPHYFLDVSGLGGSADREGTVIILATCAGLAPAPAPSVSGTGAGGAGGSTGPASTGPASTGPASTGPASTPASGTPSASASPSAGRAPSGSRSPSASKSPGTGGSGPAAAPGTVQGCQAPRLVAIGR